MSVIPSLNIQYNISNLCCRSPATIRVGAKNVFWVLPAGNLKASNVHIERIQSIVKEIAKYYGDTVLPISGLQTDGIHPSWSGSKNIVERTK